MAKKEPDTYTFTVEGGHKCVIKEPGFKELQFALVALGTELDTVGAGKAVFDTCKVSCDKIIEEDPVMLLSLCLEIYNKFVDRVEVEVKKN